MSPWCSASRTVHIQAWITEQDFGDYVIFFYGTVSNPVASFQDSTGNLGVDHKSTRGFKVWQACLEEKNVGSST